jgi:type IV pilus assembly protein PilY1
VEKIRLHEKDKWLAFVGNGFRNDDGMAYLFAMDLEVGENFADMPFKLGPESPLTPNMLASPIAVDINGDTYADSVFAGDLYGRVWRLDITDQRGTPGTFASLDPSLWEPAEIFQTQSGDGGYQAISLPVGLSFYCSGPTDSVCQGLMIYVGTGRFLTFDDKTDESLQTFYAIKDEFMGLGRDELKNRTTAGLCEEVPDPYAIKGWYVDLIEAKGERVSSPPLVLGGLVFFLTFIPDDDPCNAGGTTWLYYREFDTGCVPDKTVFGEDEDPGEAGRPVGKILIGPGFASEIVLCALTQDLLIQTSDTQIHRRKVTLPRGGIENYAWREVFY